MADEEKKVKTPKAPKAPKAPVAPAEGTDSLGNAKDEGIVGHRGENLPADAVDTEKVKVAPKKRPANYDATNDVDSAGNPQGHREVLKPASRDGFGNHIPEVLGDVVEKPTTIGPRGTGVGKDSYRG